MRGVPFPTSWRSELNIGAAQPVVDVDALARSAVQRARERHSFSEAAKLDCRPPCAHSHARSAPSFMFSLCISVCLFVRAYVRYAGDADAALRPRDDLLFHWAITIDGEIHEFDVSVRADNASERGVPFPTHWHNAVRCGDLNSRAAEAGRALEAVEDVSDIKCSLIGVPKPSCGLSGDVTSLGAILALCTPASGFMHFVLVARIEGNLWFCQEVYKSFVAYETPGAQF